MKKITVLLLFFSVQSLLAQSDYIPKENDWFFYDLSYARYLNTPAGLEMEGFSNSHTLSAFGEKLLGTSKFSLAYGFGFTSDNFRSNLGISIDSSTGRGEYSILPDSLDYDVNKLTVQYFEIPLELRYRSRPNARGNFFRVYMGGRLSVRFNAYSKFKDNNINLRYYHPEELSRFRAGVYTRIGFGNLSLYGYYGLTNIFNYDFDPVTESVDLTSIKPVNIGLSVSF